MNALPGRARAGERAERGRAEIETELDIREAGRAARRGVTGERIGEGRPEIAAETDKPFGEHVAEEAPLVGEWLGGKLYGTARNAAPGQDEKKPVSEPERKKESGSAYSGDQVMGP